MVVNDAYILSNLGLAFYKSNDKWYKLDTRDIDVPQAFHSFDYNILTLSNSEVIRPNKGQSLDDLKATLLFESKRQEALTIALQFMDTSIEKESTKKLIAAYLDELFEDSNLYQFVENRLFSVPPSSKFSPEQAAQMADNWSYKKVSDLYFDLATSKLEISMFVTCWNKATQKTDYFKDAVGIMKAYNVLVDSGHVLQFTRSIAQTNRKIWNEAVFKSMELLKVAGFSLQNKTQIFEAVLKELKATYGIKLLTDKENIKTQAVTQEMGKRIDITNKTADYPNKLILMLEDRRNYIFAMLLNKKNKSLSSGISLQQFEKFKILINNAHEENLDIFSILQHEDATVFKNFLLKYRSKCITQILKKHQNVNIDEVDFCFFRGANALLHSIKNQNFVYNDSKSIRNYLFNACEEQMNRFITLKKSHILPFSVNEYLLNRSSEDDDLIDKIVTETKFKCMRQALSEMAEDCKQQIHKYYLNNMSHAEIIKDIPSLRNERNSSAKLNRCLKKLRIRTLELLRQTELIQKN